MGLNKVKTNDVDKERPPPVRPPERGALGAQPPRMQGFGGAAPKVQGVWGAAPPQYISIYIDIY